MRQFDTKVDDMYFGVFLGIADYTHMPTIRKCAITTELITSSEKLNGLFENLRITKEEIDEMIETKYWDFKSSNIREHVIKIL